MRIVACDAGNPRVALPPAAAAFKTVGWEAHIVNAMVANLVDVPPGAMTGAAEVDGGAGIEVSGIWDQAGTSASSGAGERDVGGAGAVTSFARDSGNHVSSIHVPADDNCGRVASEAIGRFVGADFSAYSMLQRIRNAGWMIGRNVETKVTEKADSCLVKTSVVLEEIALAASAAADCPEKRSGESLSAIGDGVSYDSLVSDDGVVKRAEIKLGRVLQSFWLGNGHRGVRHGMLLLAVNQVGMAFGTDRGADVVRAGSVAFARPPAGLGEVLIAGQLIGDGRGNLGEGREEKNREQASRKAEPQSGTASKYEAVVSNWPEHPR